MEKKKLLMVAVSVGVFLVIVVSAAILVFSPPPGVTAATSSAKTDSQNWFSSGTVQEPVQDKEDLDAKLSSLTQDCQENYINLYGDSGLVPDAKLTAEKPKETAPAKVITVQPPSASGVPTTPVKAAVKPVAKPAVAASPKVTPEKPKATTTTTATNAKSYRDFWVQVGSFTSRERADGVKTTLDTKGLSAIITNQDVEGITRYRVRVGPYTSRNEADYWLAMIQSIDGFDKSQVWQSQSFR